MINILGFLGAGALGVLSGLVGTAVTTVAGYFSQKLKNKHDVEMAELDIKSMKMEAEMNIKVTKAKVEGEVEIAEVNAMKTSYTMLSQDLFDKSYMKYIMSKNWLSWVAVPVVLGFALVDFLKHLARPALTYYLVGATTWITYLMWKIMSLDGIIMTGNEAFDLFKIIVMTIIYMTASCVSWWFADRRVGRFINKLNDGNAKPDSGKPGPMTFSG